MKLILIGLGKMGYNLALNMRNHNIDFLGFDISSEIKSNAKKDGIKLIDEIKDIEQFDNKIIWTMLPAGKITDIVLDEIKQYVTDGDIVIDGGNSDYKKSIEHANDFLKMGAHFLDVGTSGGVDGARHGASFMVGGDKGAYYKMEPILEQLAAEGGLVYAGKSGGGHYLKMIHNGVLYGMMQTIGEGFEILHASEFNYDLANIAESWSKTAVVRGWLMELAAQAFKKSSDLGDISDLVTSSGDAPRTMASTFEIGVPAPVIGLSLIMRLRSQQEGSFSGKVINALRKEVGGHKTNK